MTPKQIETWIEHTEADLNKIEVSQAMHTEKLEKISTRLARVEVLWGVNIIILGFILYKVFEISTHIKY
jgi:hypothetical protein